MASGSTRVREPDYKSANELAFYDIQQTLRVSGINLNFRTWAKYGRLLPLLWQAIKPNAETRGFEAAADRLRTLAVHYCGRFGKLDAASAVKLGESQAWQIRAALDLYHYVNPKLLLLTSALRLTLLVEGPPGNPFAHAERIERGIPQGMYPMEMEPDAPEDDRIRTIFDDIKTELNLQAINSDYRTLALWPEYLEAAWKRLKPVIRRVEYDYACDRLREESRSAALSLPCPIPLRLDDIREAGENPEVVMRTMDEFERILPGLILNIALIALDWKAAPILYASPFPAGDR